MSGQPVVMTVGAYPTQIWGGGGDAGERVLFLNLSTQDTVQIGYQAGVQIPNSIPISPGGSTQVQADTAVWAFSLSGNPVSIAVSPAVEQYSLGPSQILATLNVAALAAGIAAAIAQSGIPLIAAPTLLYDNPIAPGPPGTPGAWGADVYGGTGGETGTIQEFETVTGTTVKSNRMYFQDTGTVFASSTAFPDALLAAFNLGLICIVSFIPQFSGATGPNNLPSPAQMQTDQTAMVNCLNSIIANGIPASRLRVTMRHEPENPSNNITPAQYLNLYNGVASGGLTNYAALHAVCNVYHIALADEITGNLNVQYLPFTPTLASNFVDGFMADYYGSFYVAGKFLPKYAGYADNAVPPLPFGIAELGSSTTATVILTAAQNAQFLLAEAITIGGTTYLGDPVNSVEAIMAARLTSVSPVKKNLEVNWFANYGNPNAPNAIRTSSDPRVPMLQRLTKTLAGSTLTAGTIGGGNQVKQTPISPSAVAGYATADGLSYDITINLIAGVGSTIPFAAAVLQWLNDDSLTAPAVAEQVWDMPMGASGTSGTVITGVGPQHGQFLKVLIKNHDTVACSVGIQLNSTSRPITRHNWYWDCFNSVAVPGFTLPQASSIFRNCVGRTNGLNVPVGTTSVLFGLFSGNVYVRFNPGTSGKIQGTLTPQPPGPWGVGALLNQTPVGEFTTSMVLPRSPCVIAFTNTDTVAHTVDSSIIISD